MAFNLYEVTITTKCASTILAQFLFIKGTNIAATFITSIFLNFENLAFYIQKRTFLEFSCFQIFRFIDYNYFFFHIYPSLMYSISASRCSGVITSAMRSAISFWSELSIFQKVSVIMSATVSSSRYQICSFLGLYLINYRTFPLSRCQCSDCCILT